MRRTYLLGVFGVALVAIVAAVLTWGTAKVGAQGREYPAFVTPDIPTIQGVLEAGALTPMARNGAPLFLFAQLIRNPNIQPPYARVAQKRMSYQIRMAQPGFADTPQPQPFKCQCKEEDVMVLRCRLTPDGLGGWTAEGPVALSVEMTDEKGFTATGFFSYRIMAAAVN